MCFAVGRRLPENVEKDQTLCDHFRDNLLHLMSVLSLVLCLTALMAGTVSFCLNCWMFNCRVVKMSSVNDVRNEGRGRGHPNADKGRVYAQCKRPNLFLVHSYFSIACALSINFNHVYCVAVVKSPFAEPGCTV